MFIKILIYVVFVECCIAFQPQNLATALSSEILRFQRNNLSADRKKLKSQPRIENFRVHAVKKATEIEASRSNDTLWTRRNIVSSLLAATFSPSTSLAFDEASVSVDPKSPFTVIFTVQTDAKIDATSEIEIEVRPDWAPLASERFRDLVQSGFYNDARFFRVLPGYVAQFGIAADPKLNKEWIFCEKNCRALPDEPRKQKNSRGTLSFASQGKNTRQTQIFINLGNNDGPPNFLDAQDFVPFARVVRGMDNTVKQLNSEYGIREMVSAGLTGGINQGKAAYYGAEYLDAKFPKLSIIRNAKII